MSEPLFNEVSGLRPAILSKKRSWHWCFPVNFAKFVRTPFLRNTSGRLLLVKQGMCWSFNLLTATTNRIYTILKVPKFIICYVAQSKSYFL